MFDDTLGLAANQQFRTGFQIFWAPGQRPQKRGWEAKAKSIETSRYRAVMNKFRYQRQTARVAIGYASRLHPYIAKLHGRLFTVHLHEQPSRARMALMNKAPEDLSHGIWHRAWELGELGVGYADVL